jgi:hypothetical protein
MANSTASIFIKPTVAFNRGDTFVFGSWVCTSDSAGSFQRCLTMPPNPKTGLVTLPEVVTGDLTGKFGEISLYNQKADFELGSASNSNSTSPWAIACEPAIKPSCADSPLHEHFPYGLCNASRAHAEALSVRWAGKEIVSEYNSDSNPVSGYNSDSNPVSGYYSDSYEFDFGADPDEPESENHTTEQALLGLASGLVITSTPAGRFVYWPDRKPADLTDGNSRCVAYLDSLPFQEGTPVAPAEEHTPTEVATSDSSLGSPDRQVFMTTNKMSGPSGTHPDRYLEDISADELSANAPADETDANKNARREHSRRRNERRRRLRESLPIQNLAEALNQVENLVHTTPEQFLISITMIACQAQGMHAGEVIAKLAEDAYFMRVDNRVAQVPPVRNHQPDNNVTSRSPADNGRNRTRGELPANPNRTQASAGGPSQGGNSAGGAGDNCDIVPHRDPGGGGSGGGSSSHRTGRRAGGGGDRDGRGHANSHVTGVSSGGYDAHRRIEEIGRNKSAGENDGFPAFSARLRNLLLPEKFKSLGITKYDAKQDPVQWLRCYALSIENAGGNNDTKCLYFPFCLDQAPLTWLESLEKYSIDKWDQLKDQFTSNFAGSMGRSGTRMDLAMVKQEQGC